MAGFFVSYLNIHNLITLKTKNMGPNILVIGCGDIGYPLAAKLSEGYIGQVYVTRQDVSKGFGELVNICTCGYDNKAFVKLVDTVILAVRPSQIEGVLKEIGPLLKGKLLISIAACKKIEFIKNIVGNEVRIVRAMPNIAVAVRQSMTLISYEQKMSDSDREIVEYLFSRVGKIGIIHEEKMNEGTIFTGSMPAIIVYLYKLHGEYPPFEIPKEAVQYYDLVRKILKEIILEHGFEKQIFSQVHMGLFKLMRVHKKSFDGVIHDVATKGGCTEAILKGMEEDQGFGVMITDSFNDYEKLFKDIIHYAINIGIQRLENM